MAKRRKDDFQIDEWDETLDQKASSPKDPFAPSTLEDWNTSEEWDSPVQDNQPKKPKWKWLTAIGITAAALVLVFILVIGGKPKDRSCDKPVAIETISASAVQPTELPTTELISTELPASEQTDPVSSTAKPAATEPPTTELQPTGKPRVKAANESPTPSLQPTEIPTAEPKQGDPTIVECSWYGENVRYYYQQLSVKEKACFRILYSGILHFQKEVSIHDLGCSDEEVDRVFYAIYHDSPELFQIYEQHTVHSINEKIVSISLNYRMDQDQYEEKCRSIQNIVEEIRSSVPDPEDEYAVESAIYRWIITHCRYLIEGDNSTAFTDSVLIDGKAQCSGYSQAMSLLLRTFGIKCLEVISVPEEKHQWNMVNIQGEWYQCDITWDDQGEVPVQEQNNFFCHMNVPDRLMTKHTPEKKGFTLPVCNSIEANYAFREGIYIASPNQYPDTINRINAEIEQEWQVGRRRFLIMLDQGFNEKEIESIAEQIKLPSGYFYYPVEETHCLYYIAGNEVKIHFIDVGQGDAILVQCAGESLLIDAGPAEAGTTVNRYLKETLDNHALNYVIATHEHDDHIGGMPAALSGISVDQIWTSPAIPMTWWLENVQPGMAQKSLRIEKPTLLSSFMVGGAIVTFINPVQQEETPNDRSLVVRIDFGGSSAILSADAETNAEMHMLEKRMPLYAPLLKVAHHGGNTSSSEAFIRAVSPSTAVISVGKDNKHGHPHDEPLRCLEKNNVSVYRTDEYGAIICTGDGSKWTVEVRKTR